ncbi:MAG: hypothetical protein DWQ06_14395 [Calditrichaeota bacterium]|nr:MAG: hypothetical protein DWQ06_14395 [Calditrichota bacterium]
MFNSCGTIDGTKNANNPPETTITLAPFAVGDSIRTSSSRVNIFWKGVDTDGFVESYYVASRVGKLSYADLGVDADPNNENATEGFWVKTTNTDSIFTLDANSSVSDSSDGTIAYKTHTIFVKAVDNLGMVDDAGASVSFNGKNIFPTATVAFPQNFNDEVAIWGRAQSISIIGSDADGDIESKEFTYQFKIVDSANNNIVYTTGTDGWSDWMSSTIKGITLNFGLSASEAIKKALPNPNDPTNHTNSLDEYAGLLPIAAGQNADTLDILVRVRDFGGAVSDVTIAKDITVNKDFAPVIRLKQTVNDSAFYPDNSAYVNPKDGGVNIVKFTWNSYFDSTNASLSSTWQPTTNWFEPLGANISYQGTPYKYQYKVNYNDGSAVELKSNVLPYDTNQDGVLETGEVTRTITFSDQNREVGTGLQIKPNIEYAFNLKVWDSGGAERDTTFSFMIVRPHFYDETYSTTVTMQDGSVKNITEKSLLIVDETYNVANGSDFSALPQEEIDAVYDSFDKGVANVDEVVVLTQASIHHTLFNILQPINVSADSQKYYFASPRILGKFSRVIWQDEDGIPKSTRGSADDQTGLQSSFSQVQSRLVLTDKDLEELRWIRLPNRTINDYVRQGGRMGVVTWNTFSGLSNFLGSTKIIGSNGPNVVRFAKGDFLYDIYGVQNANPSTDLIMADTTALLTSSSSNDSYGYPAMLRGKRILGSPLIEPVNIPKVRSLGGIDTFTNLAPFSESIYTFLPEEKVTLPFGKYDPINKPGQAQVKNAHCTIRVKGTTDSERAYKVVLMTLPLSNLSDETAKQFLEAMLKDLQTKN